MHCGAIKMESQTRSKIEFLPYKCFKCGILDNFKNMVEVQEKFENGSIKTTYLCKKCYLSCKKCKEESKTLI
jgi:hypothetical protein